MRAVSSEPQKRAQPASGSAASERRPSPTGVRSTRPAVVVGHDPDGPERAQEAPERRRVCAAGCGELVRVARAGRDAVGQAELDRDPDGLGDLVSVDEAAQGDGWFLAWHG